MGQHKAEKAGGYEADIEKYITEKQGVDVKHSKADDCRGRQEGVSCYISDDPAAAKKSLRRRIRDQISCLDPSYCRQADQRIIERIVSWECFRQADTVFCFVGTDREIHTKPLIQAALDLGKKIAVPKCVSKGIMEARQISSLNDLAPGSYGIEEPLDTSRIMPPGSVSLALIPCLTCSRDGRRLGYGGGFYDRYLESVPGIRAVLCRGSLMEEQIPCESHDCLMDAVIWEEGILDLRFPRYTAGSDG